ncbi:MAG: hypothetical protein O7H41_20540 [Planctomycetota bacterium]|nr:hypothetical protein [Planctomycetota bacterium]
MLARLFPRLLLTSLLLISGCRVIVKPDVFLDQYNYVVVDRTEHFEIHLELDYGEPFRGDIQERLEEVYRKVGAIFEFYPAKRTTVKIYSTPLMTNRRLEYFGYAGEKAIYSKKYDDIHRNLVHEYTHFVSARVAGIPLPSWFNEGLATYISNHMNDIERPTLEEELFQFTHGDFLEMDSEATPASITQLSRKSLSVRQTYAYSSTFISYLVEQHGFPVILAALRKTKARGGIRQALSWAIGEPFAEIDQGWIRFLRSHTGQARFDRYGMIREWYCLGPFDDSDGRGYLRTYAPEEEDLDLDASYRSLGQIVRWRRYRSNHPMGFADLRECDFLPSRYVLAYATTTIQSPAEMEVEIRCGSDSAITIWLNGEELKREELIDRGRMKRFRPDQYRMKATLNKGPNTLLVKAAQSRRHWRFAVRITDGDGQAIPGLIFRAHSEY